MDDVKEDIARLKDRCNLLKDELWKTKADVEELQDKVAEWEEE